MNVNTSAADLWKEEFNFDNLPKYPNINEIDLLKEKSNILFLFRNAIMQSSCVKEIPFYLFFLISPEKDVFFKHHTLWHKSYLKFKILKLLWQNKYCKKKEVNWSWYFIVLFSPLEEDDIKIPQKESWYNYENPILWEGKFLIIMKMFQFTN